MGIWSIRLVGFRGIGLGIKPKELHRVYMVFIGFIDRVQQGLQGLNID